MMEKIFEMLNEAGKVVVTIGDERQLMAIIIGEVTGVQYGERGIGFGVRKLMKPMRVSRHRSAG